MVTESLSVSQAAIDWQQRLWLSRSTEAVVDVVRQYLATLSRDELHSLPPTCRPVRIDDAEDVARYAFYLVSERCGSRQCTSALHRLASFFSAASTRLAQLMTH
jgi:hypothetical protein